jgi:patatin-like phospholipase/acyl hydrolase
MSDPKTAVAFVYAGGGTRGRIAQQFTKLFLNQWGVPQEDFHTKVDIFSGASAGGLQALAYAKGITPDYLDDFVLNRSKRIFTTRTVPVGCDTANDSFRPSYAQKIGLIVLNNPFYSSICPPNAGNSNWGSNILYSSLDDIFGVDRLQDLNKKVIITSYEDDTDTAVLFSNIEGYPFIGMNEKIVDVAKCTSAAPIYLPSVNLNGHRYIDGGVFDNVPCGITYNALKAIKPTANRFIIVSVGTGQETNNMQATEISPEDSAIYRLYNIFNKASYGAQQMAVVNMKYETAATLTQLHYYHFDLNFPVDFDAEFDQTTDEFMSSLDALTLNRFNEDNAAISDIISRLNL